MSTTIYIDSPCVPYFYSGEQYNDQGRGVTTWNLSNQYTVSAIPPSGTATLTFTCTVPKCYSSYNTIPRCGDTNILGQDACNIVFNAWTNENTSSTIELQYMTNTFNTDRSYLSGVAGHGATQAFELANTGCAEKYNDMGENTFRIINNSPVTVNVDHFKVYRTYKMCNLNADAGGSCTIPAACHPGDTPGTNGNLDFTRDDTPCNFEDCGGLSSTQYHDETLKNQTIPANGGIFSWTFDFSDHTPGGSWYLGKSICLFNFNYIQPASTNNYENDVRLDALINGHTMDTYYLSKYQDQKLSPSHDLTQNVYYNDVGLNTVTLVNSSSVPVVMSNDGIDVYRVFRTVGVCGSQCQSCNTCYANQSCPTCYGFCQTCVTACELCESGYNWCELCESSYTWPCEMCESQCYTSCYEGCEIVCQGGCQSCLGCQSCDTCVSCQMNNAYCDPGCYDCQACNACEPSCYDAQTCYACQVTCFDCEQCYAYY